MLQKYKGRVFFFPESFIKEAYEALRNEFNALLTVNGSRHSPHE